MAGLEPARGDHDPVHAAVDEQVEVGLLSRRVVRAIAQQDRMAALQRGVLDRTHDLGEVRVGDVRDHEAERMRRSELERPGHAGGPIAQSLDRCEDARPRRRADRR